MYILNITQLAVVFAYTFGGTRFTVVDLAFHPILLAIITSKEHPCAT